MRYRCHQATPNKSIQTTSSKCSWSETHQSNNSACCITCWIEHWPNCHNSEPSITPLLMALGQLLFQLLSFCHACLPTKIRHSMKVSTLLLKTETMTNSKINHSSSSQLKSMAQTREKKSCIRALRLPMARKSTNQWHIWHWSWGHRQNDLKHPKTNNRHISWPIYWKLYPNYVDKM